MRILKGKLVYVWVSVFSLLTLDFDGIARGCEEEGIIAHGECVPVEGSQVDNVGIRPIRNVPRINYNAYHNSGSRFEVDEAVHDRIKHFWPQNSGTSSENSEITSNMAEGGEGNQVLAKETPLGTPGGSPAGSGEGDETIVRDSVSPNNSLWTEMNEAEREERNRQLEEEQLEWKRKLNMLAEQTRLEAKERQVALMKQKWEELVKARETTTKTVPVLNEQVLSDDPTMKKMADMLKLLKSEQKERARIERENEEKERNKKLQEMQNEEKLRKEAEVKKEKERIETMKMETEKLKLENEKKRLQEEQAKLENEREKHKLQTLKWEEERKKMENVVKEKIEVEQAALKKQKEAEEAKKLEEQKMEDARKAEEAKKLDETRTGEGSKENEKVDCILEWVQQQQMQQKNEAQRRQELEQMKKQIAAMSEPENRRICQTTGANLFAGLEVIQEEGGPNLVQKAQEAMMAANSAQSNMDDNESEGESSVSHASSVRSKAKKLKSGLATRSAPKVKFSIEWAQHNMGEEYDANPLAFNQLKLHHFVMGEAQVLLNCENPDEYRARLKLIRRMAYWLNRYEWHSVRNIYSLIMRGLEVVIEGWEFMCVTMKTCWCQYSTIGGGSRDEIVKPKRPRDTYFCAGYQRNECNQESPHMARVGPEGTERQVVHVCSSCLLMDGKKLGHPNGGPGCPRGKQ